GRIAYWLALEPDYDVEGKVVVLDLVLRRPEDAADGPNRLDPHHWHGMQKWIFAARDFAQGVEASIYGRERGVVVPASRLRVHIEVLGAAVNKTGDPQPSEFEWKTLQLQVGVSN